MKHIHVACAIIECDGLILATQRSAKMTMPLKWEFPGGKINPGETAAEGLRREIKEELAVEVRVGQCLPASTHHYPAFKVTLYPFVCTIESGEIILTEHVELAWLPAENLASLDWAEADLPVLECYRSEYSHIADNNPKVSVNYLPGAARLWR